LEARDPTLHYNLANALAAEGKLDEAVSHYESALKQQPDFPEALLNLGAALNRKRDREGARRQYQRALALRPGYLDAMNNLALLDRG